MPFLLGEGCCRLASLRYKNGMNPLAKRLFLNHFYALRNRFDISHFICLRFERSATHIFEFLSESGQKSKSDRWARYG